MSSTSFRQILDKAKNVLNNPNTSYVWTEDDLINAESAIGRNVFGTVSEKDSREFFCHQKNVWLWYENGITIRYEVRPQGVFKKVLGGKYQKIEGIELNNFRQATKNYLELVKTKLYNA